MRILMAYDGTIEGQRALLAAPEINLLPHDETHLLAVLPMPAGLFLAEGYVPGQVIDEERAQAKARLDECVAALIAQGFPATGHMSWGEPVEEICKLAAQLKSSMILVAHPRATSFAARWWRGWVGSSLLEQTPCSLLVSVY
ncbi:MAG: universal stress protein [Burkholderiales bacterium]|nr:universal stress protein [Burkholderiales bacterium]